MTSKLKLSRNKGFTLIECLVALFIIALVLASATRAIGLNVEDVRDSYAREVANWVADNQYSQYVIDGVYPDLGHVSKPVDMAGLHFILNTTVAATPNPYFRKIDIAISEANSPGRILFKTIYFMAQY